MFKLKPPLYDVVIALLVNVSFLLLPRRGNRSGKAEMLGTGGGRLSSWKGEGNGSGKPEILGLYI